MDNLTISCSRYVFQNNSKWFLLANCTTTASYCWCNKCFTGDLREIKKYPKNISIYNMSEENIKDYTDTIYMETIIYGLLGIIAFVSNLLSLQVFLFSKKIRITNLGIYLILFSLIGVIASITEIQRAFMDLASHCKKLSQLNRLINCALHILLELLRFCLYWFCACIAVERILIEYSFISIYDSRRRSLIISILLFLLIPLINLLPILLSRKDSIYTSYNCCLSNITSIGRTFYSIFNYISYIVPLLLFIIACVVIFNHLTKHRRSLVNDESFRSSLILIASKHYDFFVPIILFCLTTTPKLIFDTWMNYSRANSIEMYPTQTVMLLLNNCSLPLTFFAYIYLSNVYFNEFWQTSPFGRFLIYVKNRFISF
ncbi:unnamed protein product [Rotaria sp. Silwood1]|nr:unnamed protein product [Rotaria sp. Silwood1]CAF1659203.1 unnamed protein product [Rotaria sp. Silwood1]